MSNSSETCVCGHRVDRHGPLTKQCYECELCDEYRASLKFPNEGGVYWWDSIDRNLRWAWIGVDKKLRINNSVGGHFTRDQWVKKHGTVRRFSRLLEECPYGPRE